MQEASGADSDTESFARPHSQILFLPDVFKGPVDRPPARPSLQDIYPQVIASCFAHLLVLQAGINMAYSAILLPQLMGPDSDILITKNEASWIASLVAISTPVGCLVCGPFMDHLGRKLFSLVTLVPLTLSWFLLVFSPSAVWIFYLARLLSGFGAGLTTVSLVYISEVSSASWRPMLLCLNSVFVSLGILLTNVLGVYLAWRVVASIILCLTLASALAIFSYNPESPHWLLNFRPPSDKHTDEAKQALQFLYPNKQMFVAEWDRLTKASEAKRQQREEVETKQDLLGNMKFIVNEFFKQSTLFPFILLLVIFFFQQLSGTYPIIFYAVQVFQCIGGKFAWGLDADSATILLGVLRFLISLLTAGLSRRYGRRPLLMVSGVGMTVSSFVAAVFFHKMSKYTTSVFNEPTESFNSTALNSTTAGNPLDASFMTVDVESNTIGLICVLSFVGMSSVGMLIIPWTLIGEILPLSTRGTGAGILFSYAYVLMFVAVKIFPYKLDLLNISGVFYFFCFTSLINVIVVYIFLPETLGKSFEEIENAFTKSRINK